MQIPTVPLPMPEPVVGALKIIVAIGSALVIAGGTIATTRGDIQSLQREKLDAVRFERDSVAREVDRQLLERIDRRVSAIYCADKPPGCQ